MKCPKCLGKLSPVQVNLHSVYASGKLKGQGKTEQLEIDQCFVCAGVWFQKGELDKYLKERMTIVGASRPSESPVEYLDHKPGKCPQCQAEMKKDRAPKDPKVQIDKCEKCGGIWLDDVEIDKLERAALTIIEKVLMRFTKTI